MLRLNTIYARPGSTHKTRRLGRGAGSGKGGTSTKGHKGQRARKSGNVRPGFEGGQTPLYRKLPKRGFTNIFARTQIELNLKDLANLQLSDISLETLKTAGRVKGTYERLVILGTGEIKKALTVRAHRVSASAREKIEKAGGTIQLQSFAGAQEVGKKKTKKAAKAV